MKYILTIILFFGICFFGIGQQVTGKVVDKETNEPIANVMVTEVDTDNWTLTQKNGMFSMQMVKKDLIALEFSVLGRPNELFFTEKQTSDTLIIKMDNNNLRHNEVVVTASRTKGYSELLLNKEAIENVQSFSIEDALLQLPGQTTSDFNLNQFKNIVFRTATQEGGASNGNRAFGTSIVVNGIPISNNENMQSFNPNASGVFSNSSGNSFGISTNTFSNADVGVDLREISTNNVEEIKVIQGIPSAQYGDLTSGLVLITSKVGRAPYRLAVSLRDATTDINLSKGWNLKSGHYLSTAFNYLDSKSDPRDNLLGYKRLSSNISWKYNNPKANFTNVLSTSFNFNLDDAKSDPDDVSSPVVKNEKKGISISDNLKWKFQNKWLSNIDINFGIDYDKQLSRREAWLNIGIRAAPATDEEGIHQALIVPAQYTSISIVEGIPISTFFTTNLYKNWLTKNNWVHKLSLGIGHRSSTNKGSGRKSTIGGLHNFFTFPMDSDEGKLGFRDYDFTQTKTIHQYSTFIEDNITKALFDKRDIFNISLGLRYENQAGYSTWQPRINSFYSFKKNIKLRGGIGWSSKAPSLNQRYTGSRYLDKLIGDGIYIYPGKYQIAWIQTVKTAADNLDLKPSQSYRTETGIDLTTKIFSFNFSVYYNKLYNGFINQRKPEYKILPHAVVTVPSNGNLPTYSIDGTEKLNYFTNTVTNDLTSIDKGLETIISFKRINSLHLDIALNGSYTQSKSYAAIKNYIKSTDLLSKETYGVFNTIPVTNDRMTLGSSFTYHLSAIGFLINFRTEHILKQDSKSFTSNYPNGYLDEEFNYHEIPEADRQNSALYGHLIQDNDETENKLQKPIHNFHLRVSKDFLNGFRFSFYATNFLNYKPYHYDENNEKVLDNIANFSFGARLEYEF